MSMSDGSIRWWSKIMRILFCMCIVVVVALLYRHYLSGTIKLDASLLTKIESSQLKNNYKNLIDKGFVLYPDAEGVIAQLGYPETDTEDILGVDRIYIVIRQTPSTDEECRHIESGYRKNSIWNSVRAIGRLGKCDSWALFETADYQIQMIDYDAVDITGERFEIALKAILEIVSNSVE